MIYQLITLLFIYQSCIDLVLFRFGGIKDYLYINSLSRVPGASEDGERERGGIRSVSSVVTTAKRSERGHG